jgi:hypothetical protein
MNEHAPAEQATPPEPLDQLLLRTLKVEENEPLSASVEALMSTLAEAGYIVPGGPPARQILADAQQFAERVILSELAVRLLRTLVLGNIIHPETPTALDWLKDWIDGTLEGHGPIGKPMIWPDRLPFIAGLMRQWGFQPTPSIPPYVTRQPQPPVIVQVAG